MSNEKCYAKNKNRIKRKRVEDDGETGEKSEKDDEEEEEAALKTFHNPTDMNGSIGAVNYRIFRRTLT